MDPTFVVKGYWRYNPHSYSILSESSDVPSFLAYPDHYLVQSYVPVME